MVSMAAVGGKATVAVFGAGPAGLMAAERLAAAGCDVTVYERMASPARKFLMAGRGGLNLTHSAPLEDFLRRYTEDGGHIAAAVRAFPPQDLVRWANGLGIATFVGSSGRVFPKAMKSSPLLRAWLKRLDDGGAKLKTRHTWLGFADGNGQRVADGEGNECVVVPDAAILALGGASWPRLGADGGWVREFIRAGIPITPLSPSNCGIRIAWSDHFRSRFEGAPLKRIAISVGGASGRGEAVVTRNGLEGGVVYALGQAIRKAITEHGQAALAVDLKPETSEGELASRLAGARKGDSLSNLLRKFAGLEPAAIGLLREQPIDRDAALLARRIKSVPLVATAVADITRAISTAGGVASAAIDRDLMLVHRPGVFVAGEMLDWDAPTGGFLLQACFATGIAAAAGALHWIDAHKPLPARI